MKLPGHWTELKLELEQFGYLHTIHLSPLDYAESEQLVETTLGAPDPPVASRVLPKTTGNPLYILESLRYLRETGQLTFRSGQWVSSSSGPKDSFLPAAVSTTIAGRLDRLTPDQRDLLDHLAFINRPISVAELASILQTSGESLSDEIYDLDRLNLVRLSGRLHAPRITVAHDWIARTISLRLDESSSKHRQIHKRIGSELEHRFLRLDDNSRPEEPGKPLSGRQRNRQGEAIYLGSPPETV